MHSDQVDLLKTTVQAVGTWQTAAQAVRVTILDIALQYPDGSHVRFSWDEALGTWAISTP